MPTKVDATQAGVSDENENLNPEGDEKPDVELTTAEKEALERQKAPLSRREEMFNLITEHRNQELAQEIGIPPEEPKKEEPEEEEEDEVLKDETPKPEKKKKAKEAAPSVDEEDDLVIDGVTQKVPKSKIYDTGKRALQKEIAADKKLEDAGKRAKEILAAAEQEAEKIKGKQRPSDQDAVDDSGALDKDPNLDHKLSDWVSKIQYGSEEEGKEALRQILMQGRGNTPATQAIKEEDVIEKVEQKLALKEIRKQFTKEFSDLVEDPELYGIVVMRVNAALTGGKPNAWETYQEIGNAVRERYVRHETITTEDEKTKTQDKPINLEQRREKKRSIDTLKPASGRTTTVESPMENPNPSATIAEIRKARHQG